MKGSIKRYCFCKDPATGKELGARCPELAGTKHGEWEYRDRHMTGSGLRPFRRRGFPTRKAASEFRADVYELMALARGDAQALARIGDLVFDKTRRGGQLPAVDDVRRRLGLGGDLDRSQLTSDWLRSWYAGKRKLRDSTANGYGQHLDNWLIPHLGHIPLDRLSPEHISDLFDLIEEWNSEIADAANAGRKPVLPGDVRKRARPTGVATQRRIYATLRNALNAARKARRIDFNPCDAVEMPPEYREPRLVWSPEQVATFLDASADDRLAVMYRLILLHGPRRGEAVGARRSAFNFDAKELRVLRPILQLGGKLVESRPKSHAGERVLCLDAETAELIRRDLRRQAKERLAWGEAYDDNDLIWCREDGSPYSPDYVSRHFVDLAETAGLPRIQLHAGRHTAATLYLEAGVDIRVVSERMGHSTTSITQNLYQHVRRVVHDRAAEAVVQLLPERRRSDERTGS